MPYNMREWIIIKSKANRKNTVFFTFTTPPKNNAKTKGILLMNKNEDDFNEIFNKLVNLFYDITEIIMNYNKLK